MPVTSRASAASTPRVDARRAFSESQAWQTVGEGWRQLHGSYRNIGFSFEWHDFTTAAEIPWHRSFHPGSIEICLNLAGRAVVAQGRRRLEFAPMTAGFYWQDDEQLVATRAGGERHQFLTVELSPAFLRQHFSGDEANLHPIVQGVLNEVESDAVSDAIRLTTEHQQLVNSVRHPPVFASAQPLWYQAKALEIMVAFFFQAPPEREFFCQRQKRLSQDRVERVIAILRAHLAEPPSLEELGKQVGCSPFYLSRIFSQEVGKTISQYLRQLRMEKAAELLRSGNHNVTQVAMEVGYSSSSHFSVAFHETYGCCPGLFPISTFNRRTRKAA